MSSTSDSYAVYGPSTTMRARNDKVVSRLRDLSRRFEQSDFVSLADAIAAAHPNGYDAFIPDGLGGVRALTLSRW